MSLEINTLGRLQLIVDGSDVTTQLDASRTFLLIYLADKGQPQSRMHLAELLWPDRPPGRARSNLRTLLSRLRPLLADYLRVTPEWIALQPVSLIQFDVHTFEAQLAAAQSTKGGAVDPAFATALIPYQGDFLATYTGDANSEIDAWIMTRRLALHGQAIQTLRHLLRETCEHSLATSIDYARQLFKLEPLDELACNQLMRLLAESGQRDEALWHYQRYRRALTETWATATPSEELLMVAAKIRLGLPVPCATSPVVQTKPAVTQKRGTPPAPPTATPTVAKQQELATIQQPLPPPLATNGAPQAAAVSVLRHFPAPLKPLIGRVRESNQLIKWLDLGYRLISVTGLGGVGKSHFVRTLIAAQQARWPNGALFVTLPTAPIFTDHDERQGTKESQRQISITTLCRAIAAALDLSLQPHQDYAEQIQDVLRTYHCCIVLDNFETLLPATPYLQHLLAQASGITLVITSRLHLALATAVNIALTGLALVADQPARERALLAEAEGNTAGTALALLSHNLARHLPDFQPHTADLPALRRICQALHGLPLALEMVPVLARQYTLAVVAEKLEAEPLLLTADYGDLPAAQRSLYAVMDASFTAATPAVQAAVVRLGVFTGAFTAENAHCVISSNLLDSLHQQNWIEAQDDGRFTLHPLVAAFVRSQCVDLQWAEVYQKARRQHANYYAKIVATQPFLHDAYQMESVAWLHQNFEQVMNASLTLLEQDAPAALQLLHALAIHGHHYGDLQRVQRWLHQGLTLIPHDTPGRLHLLLAYVSGATELGHIAEAAATLAEARTNLAAKTANAEIFALYERLGWAAHLDYDAETPQLRRDGYTYFSQALLLAEEIGDQVQIVKMLTQRAFLACWEPAAHAQARTDMMRAVELAYHLNQQGLLGNVYKMFAFVEFVAGRPALAQQYSDQAIKLLQAEPYATMTLGWLYVERTQIALTLADIAAAEHYANLAHDTFAPADFVAGIAQCDIILGLVALRKNELATADWHWRRAYAVTSKQLQQEKVLTMAMIGVGLVQLEIGDQILGAALVAAATAKYQARAFHWVQPEQAFIETMLARAALQHG